MPNVCMIGHGMMGIWHPKPSSGRRTPCCTPRRRSAPKAGRPRVAAPAAGHTQNSAEAFARSTGYKKSTTSFDEALTDPRGRHLRRSSPGPARPTPRCL